MPSLDLQACETSLREKYLRGRQAYERANPGMLLRVTATYRSVGEQQGLYAMGRTRPGQIVTQLDGITQKSNHNAFPARAIDFCVTIGGKVSWRPEDYICAGECLEAEGLIWGGRWPHFKDYPHVELPSDAPHVDLPGEAP